MLRDFPSVSVVSAVPIPAPPVIGAVFIPGSSRANAVVLADFLQVEVSPPGKLIVPERCRRGKTGKIDLPILVVVVDIARPEGEPSFVIAGV
jgi:hypothetical protein